MFVPFDKALTVVLYCEVLSKVPVPLFTAQIPTPSVVVAESKASSVQTVWSAPALLTIELFVITTLSCVAVYWSSSLSSGRRGKTQPSQLKLTVW